MSFQNILQSCGLAAAPEEGGNSVVQGAPLSFDQVIDQAVAPAANCIGNIVFFSVPLMDGLEVRLILVWLVAAALFFTFYLRFVNFRFFPESFRLVFDKRITGSGDGQLSSFQALMASLSGTVGLGNIAGVALAVSTGGPGATVWMILMGFFSMSTKFSEVVLGIKHRRHMNPDNPDEISGGPMYYLADAFNKYKMPLAGKLVAGLFAVCCIGGAIGGGNMFQANQAYLQALNVTGGEESILNGNGWLFGLGLAFMVGVVIIGGIRSIGRVAAALVPAMGIIYLVAGLVVIGIFWQNIPHAIVVIFESAFSLQAGIGGLLGGLLVGVQRAVFSNESGLGSAAIVHSAVRTEHPVAQGIVAMLGPFLDTIVICTLTALVIVTTGVYETAGDGVEGVALTSAAFEQGISWFPYVLALTVFLFAYSTMITWSYLGEKALTFLCGENRFITLGYQIFFCLCVIIGCAAELKNIVAFTDSMILSMGIPNIIGLYLFAPELRRDVKDYIAKRKSGEI